MICPLLFFQSELAWPWNFFTGVVLVALTALLTWLAARPKTKSEIHRSEVESKKSEIDTVLSVAREFPLLLKQIAIAEKKSREDERIIFQKEGRISELETELKKCLEGGPCAELKRMVLVMMADVEPLIQKIERSDLLERFNKMKEKLNQ